MLQRKYGGGGWGGWGVEQIFVGQLLDGQLHIDTVMDELLVSLRGCRYKQKISNSSNNNIYSALYFTVTEILIPAAVVLQYKQLLPSSRAH